MPGFVPEHAGKRLDLAYLYADGADEPIVALAQTAKNIDAYGVVVYTTDIPTLYQFLKESDIRLSAVVNFPDGRTGLMEIDAAVRQANYDGAYGCDLVVNLAAVEKRDWKSISAMCASVSLRVQETKLICQIPFLWQYDRDAIPAIIDRLPELGVGIIKDWTSKETSLGEGSEGKPFSTKISLALKTRLEYTQWMANYIESNNIRYRDKLLQIKIAGCVDATNAKQFVDAGADILGTSAHKAQAIIKALQ